MILIVGMEDKDQLLLNLGKRIKELRLQQDLTQQELADKCLVDRNYIGMLERGERNPSYLTLCKISRGLNQAISKILKF